MKIEAIPQPEQEFVITLSRSELDFYVTLLGNTAVSCRENIVQKYNDHLLHRIGKEKFEKINIDLDLYYKGKDALNASQ